MATTLLLTTLLTGQAAVNDYDPTTRLTAEQRAAKTKIEELGGTVWMNFDPQGDPVESIAFMEDRFTDADVALLQPFHGLRLHGLAFVRAKLTEDGIARALHQFRDLKSVTVFQMRVGDRAIQPLERFDNLVNVALGGTLVTSAVFVHLAHQPGLEYLTASETGVDDRGLKHLEGLPRLKSVFIGNTRITSAGMVSFAKVGKLETLFLNNANIDDDGLSHLSSHKTLWSVGLQGTKVTNAGMAHLAKLKTLKDLDLERTRVDAEGLKLLQSLPKLTEVRWEGSRAPTPQTRRFNTLFHLHLPANADVPAWRDDRAKYESGELELDFP